MNSLNSRWPVIGVAIAVLLVGACAPSGTQSATTQPSASSGPKVLKMARNAEPFSPFVPWQIDDNPALFISVNVYDTLLRTTKDGVSVEPGLASKWESTADGLTWTFTLRDGIKFSDGSPLKGSDVTASLDMARGGAKSAWKDNYKAIKEITAPDDKTVKIVLSQPYAPLLSVLAMFSGGILPADMARATGAKAQTFTIQQSAFIILNVTKPPLNDVKVRQALNYATDKDAIIKSVYFGQAKFMNSPIPQGTFWDKNLPGYPYDLEKAKTLMSQSAGAAGFKMDMQVRSGNTNFANTAVILKEAWAKLGVTVDIQTLDTAVVRTNYRAGDFMSTPTAWTNDMNDPTEIVNYAMRGGASPFAYWTRYNNPDLNDKITKADLEQDAKKREAQYSEIQKIYLDAAPLVFIAYLGATAGWRNNVDGFLIDGLSYYRFEDVKINK